MKKTLQIVAFLILNTINAQQIKSDFSTNDENWVVIGDATSALPFYLADGGNPGGYVSADDTATGGVWYWSAPAKFLGDQNTSFGKRLSFDLKQSYISSQFNDNDIIISNGAITIVLDLLDNPGIEWTSYSVTLDTTNPWKLDNITNSELATAEQILAVLSNITSLKIRGEYVSGADTGGLDNVILQNNILDINSFSSKLLSCYPNPSSGIFNIQTDNSFENASITISDLNGRIVHQSEAENLQNKAIDLHQVQKGIYILNIKNATFNHSQKIVKQ